jgi:predicted ribonuclease YlaK
MSPESGNREDRIKYFVLDTNVLLHNPNALFAFEENHVIIPFMVIEELDRFKTQNNDIGRNARQCIRHLDRLRERGRLIDGVKWGNGNGAATAGESGTIRIDFADYEVPPALRDATADNRIIAVAYAAQAGGCPHGVRLQGPQRAHQVRRARHQDRGLREPEGRCRPALHRLRRASPCPAS